MKIFTLSKRAMLALSTLFIMTLNAAAQGLGDPEGYINIYLQVKVVPEGSGRVSVVSATGGLPTWKDNLLEVRKTVPVYSGYVVLLGNTRITNSIFVGWFLDNGDGQFNYADEELLNTDAESSMIQIPATYFVEEGNYYETEAQAKVAQMPTNVQATVFAYFTNGATVEVDYNQSHVGSVEISNPTNSIGDEITVTATPIDGYEFAFWKNIYGPTLGEADHGIVSYDNPYTFTVQGGEHLYAYFTAKDAPVLQFPAEGGWKAMGFTQDWVLDDRSDAYCYAFVLNELENRDGQVYLRVDPDSIMNIVQYNYSDSYGGTATMIYGRGEVRFAYAARYGMAPLNPIVQWTGSREKTLSDPSHSELYHVYRFVDNMEGFFEFGHTDDFIDPDAPTKVTVPANTAYIAMSAYDLTDPDLGISSDGSIPSIIALSEKAFGPFVEHATDINQVKVNEAVVKGQKIYTISGIKVQATNEPGLYIVDGKKVYVE